MVPQLTSRLGFINPGLTLNGIWMGLSWDFNGIWKWVLKMDFECDLKKIWIWNLIQILMGSEWNHRCWMMLTSCLNASASVFCWLNMLFMLHCMKTLFPHSSWYCWWFNTRIMLVAQSWWVCILIAPPAKILLNEVVIGRHFMWFMSKRMWFSLIFPVGYAWKWGIHPQNNYFLNWMGTWW